MKTWRESLIRKRKEMNRNVMYSNRCLKISTFTTHFKRHKLIRKLLEKKFLLKLIKMLIMIVMIVKVITFHH